LLQYAGMQKYDNSVYMIHNENVFLPYIHLHSRAFFYGLLIDGGLSRLNVGYMIIELLVYIIKYTIKAQNALESCGIFTYIHFGKKRFF